MTKLLRKIKLVWFCGAMALFAFGPAVAVGFSDSGVTVGASGPLIAFRVPAFLGWAIRIRNDSAQSESALYTINGWADLRAVPAHRTVRAGYVLGREIPTFRFASDK